MNAKETLAQIKELGLLRAGNLQEKLNAMAVSFEEEFIELRGKCDALQLSHDNIINSLGIKGDGPVSKLVIEYVMGLVAENVALKSRTVTVPAKVHVKDMKCNVVRWAQVIDALSGAGVAFVRDDGELIAGMRETPATNATITEIETKAIEAFVSKLAYGLRTAGGGDGYHSNPYHECADLVELKGGDYVEALRAGGHP